VHGLEWGEPFGYVAGLSGVNACLESEINFNEMHDLARTPLEACHDMFVHERSPNLGSNHVIPNPFKHSHVSTMLLQPSFSLGLDFDVPNYISKLHDSSIDMGNVENVLNTLGESVGTFM